MIFFKQMILGLSLILLTVGFLGCSSLQKQTHENPSYGSSQPDLSKKKILGRKFLVEALKHYQFVKDPEVTHLVQTIGKRIVKAQGSNPDNYRFMVVRGSPPNAFAIPGGYIFIFDSLLSKFRTPEELAGVLAHEIAHVELDHFFQDQNKLSAANLATLVAILLSRGNPAVIAGGIAANVDLQLRYSRENEAEADAYAFSYLKKSGFNPESLLASLQTIAFYERFSRVDIPVYFSTHPNLSERQGHLDLLIKQSSNTEYVSPYTGDWESVRISLLAGQGPALEIDSLVKNLDQDNKSPERRHYLSGIWYLKSGACVDAVREFEAAILLNPSLAIYQAKLASCFLIMQKVDKALLSAQKSLRLDPDEPTALSVMGKINLHKGDPKSAVSFFIAALKHQPTNHLLHLRLAESYGKTGDPVLKGYHLGRFFRFDLKPREALAEYKKIQIKVEQGTPLAFKIKKEIFEILRDGI